MSGRRDREERHQERLREDEQAGAAERRQLLIKLASAAAFLVLAAVAVLIVVNGSETSGGDSSDIVDVAEVSQQLSGIAQQGMVLGEPGAKVRLLEFGDLQCTACKGYAEGVLPELIENQVRSGEAKLDFRNFTIIGAQSTAAGAAAIAAGEQGRGWNFIELFYRNQGAEESGYADDAFLTAIARGAGVPNIARWNADRRSKGVLAEVAESTAQAERLDFTGTPSFAVEGPATAGLEALETPASTASLESAVEGAAG
jgi:protein-disulfide isomerase